MMILVAHMFFQILPLRLPMSVDPMSDRNVGSMGIRKITRSGAHALVELSITERDTGVHPVTKSYDLPLPGYGDKQDDDIQKEASRIMMEKWEQERLGSI